MPRKRLLKPRRGSKTIPASIQVVHIVKGIGEMVPVVGIFVKGVAESAGVLLENLEQFKNNEEDMKDLAGEIIEIVKIIRDAGIQVSAIPEGIKCVAGLRTACLDFQEFLSDLSAEVNEMNCNKGSIRGKLVDFLSSRGIKEDITRHRKLVDNARANFNTQLLLNLFQVTSNSNTTMSRMHEEISLLRSTIQASIIAVPRKQTAPNSGGPVNRETQLTRQLYKMPGGIDLMEGFQKMNSRAQFHKDSRYVSTPMLLEWLYKLQLRFLFFWWYFHFRWSFSFGFEISFATQSRNGLRTWAVIIGINAYQERPLRGCVADALLMNEFLTRDLGVPKDRIQCLLGPTEHGLYNNSLIPSRINIVNTLLSLTTNSEIVYGDNIIIYFSGYRTTYYKHGFYTSYSLTGPVTVKALCPMDRHTLDLNGDRVPDISDREINTILTEISRVKGHRITLIQDCRQSCVIMSRSFRQGGVGAASLEDMLCTAEQNLGHLPCYTSVFAEDWQPDMNSHVFLSACREYQDAREIQGKSSFQGVFTESLVRTLKAGHLHDGSTYIDLAHALRMHRQIPVVGGKYKGACIWYRDSD